MNLRQLQERTAGLSRKFPVQFDKRDVLLDMVEEVGELAQAVLIVEKRKYTNDPAKRKSHEDVVNAIGDILYDLLVLADKYDVDVETAYLSVLEEIEDRVNTGEFDGEQS